MPSTLVRTALYSRQIPGGVFVVDDAGRFTGDHFWVDSGQTTTGGDTTGHGRHPDAPFLTLDYAVGQCTASNGDVITVMPGHAETVSEAAGLALDVAGITIVGVGDGDLQPTVTLDTADTADVDVDAADITVENIHFIAGFADIVAFFDVNADDFTLRKCRMTGDGAGLNALIWIQDDGAASSNRITIEDCFVDDVDASNTHFTNFAGTGDGHKILRNVIYGDFGTLCIGGAGVVTHITVADNVIYNEAATNDSAINFDATATGIVVRNLACGGAAQANGFTMAAMVVAENYYGVLSEELSAILDPIAT